MKEPSSLDELEKFGQEVLDPLVFDFYRGGSDGENTLRRNSTAFNSTFSETEDPNSSVAAQKLKIPTVQLQPRIGIRPRVLTNDVSCVDLHTELLGGACPVGLPIGASPTAFHKLAHPDGEIATAKGCQDMGSVMTVSAWTNTHMELIANSTKTNALLWQNTYIFQAMRCGTRRTLLFLCWPAHIPSETKRNYLAGDPAAVWRDFEDVCRYSSLPVVAKGIMTGPDAREAFNHGAKAIWVSNHGGRQLDCQFSTIEALPEVVKEVDGECDVYLDGGIRSGTDVFKALAMGAKSVFMGRPIIYGLSYDGENGVKKVLSILKNEFELIMALAGCNKLSDLTEERLRPFPSSQI